MEFVFFFVCLVANVFLMCTKGDPLRILCDKAASILKQFGDVTKEHTIVLRTGPVREDKVTHPEGRLIDRG
jgi:hypothetical protein